MALPVIVPILAVLGIGFVALKAVSKKKTSTAPQPPSQTERKGVSVVRGALRFDPDVAGKILASLTLYKTTGLDHQPQPNTPNAARMTRAEPAVMQEGNDRGFQFAALESANGNAILAPENLWTLSTMPKDLVIHAVHPSHLPAAAAPGSGWAILTDTTSIGALATAPSKEVVASLGGSMLGPEAIPPVPGGPPK